MCSCTSSSLHLLSNRFVNLTRHKTIHISERQVRRQHKGGAAEGSLDGAMVLKEAVGDGVLADGRGDVDVQIGLDAEADIVAIAYHGACSQAGSKALSVEGIAQGEEGLGGGVAHALAREVEVVHTACQEVHGARVNVAPPMQLHRHRQTLIAHSYTVIGHGGVITVRLFFALA